MKRSWQRSVGSLWYVLARFANHPCCDTLLSLKEFSRSELQLSHHLAAPILYESIVTNGLPDLLLGLSTGGTKRQLSSSSRIRKDESVYNTKTLRIAGFNYSRFSNEPAFNVRSLLRNGDWRLVTLNPRQKQKHQRKIEMEKVRGLDFVLRAYENTPDNPPFAKLEKLVLGQRGVQVREFRDLDEGDADASDISHTTVRRDHRPSHAPLHLQSKR